MIAILDGILVSKAPDTVIIDVRGVGYEVNIPLSTFYKLPEAGERARLNIHTIIKDDAIILNGFGTIEEKEVFLHLLSVTGIGPKLARNILSGITVDDFKSSLVAKELAVLVKVPGLGKKTAERLILELSEKFSKLVDGTTAEAASVPPGASLDGDVISALINLGYKEAAAKEAAVKAKREFEGDISFEIFFKAALKLLSAK